MCVLWCTRWNLLWPGNAQPLICIWCIYSVVDGSYEPEYEIQTILRHIEWDCDWNWISDKEEMDMNVQDEMLLISIMLLSSVNHHNCSAVVRYTGRTLRKYFQSIDFLALTIPFTELQWQQKKMLHIAVCIIKLSRIIGKCLHMN